MHGHLVRNLGVVHLDDLRWNLLGGLPGEDWFNPDAADLVMTAANEYRQPNKLLLGARRVQSPN